MSRAHTAADCAEQAGSAIATNCLNAILNAPSQAESVSMHARALLLEVARQFHRDDNGRMLLSRAFRRPGIRWTVTACMS